MKFIISYIAHVNKLLHNARDCVYKINSLHASLINFITNVENKTALYH
jgi:hypothetical protein